MPSLISDALSYFLEQQHQLAITTCTRQLYNFLIPTIINDRNISEKLLFFYLQKIPPYTICYINKLCVTVHHGYYSRSKEPTQKLEKFGLKASSSLTIAAPVDIFHLIVHGHLRHITFFGASDYYPSSFEGFFDSDEVDPNSNNNTQEDGRRSLFPSRVFILSHSKLTKCITSHRVGIVELRFVSLRFQSELDFGKIISLLAAESAATRTSLEILQILNCEFSGSSRPTEDEVNLCVERSCFLPGMKSNDELQNLRGLLELEVSGLPFFKSWTQSRQQQLIGCFCFEILPPYLVKLSLAKSGENCTFKLHPSHEVLDWENMPSGLIELNLNGAASSLLATSPSKLSNENESDKNDNNIIVLCKKRIRFENFPRSLQILKASQSAFDGPLQFQTKDKNNNNNNNICNYLREIILMSNANLCGPLDFTKLPPLLEIFSVTRCSGLGRVAKTKRGDNDRRSDATTTNDGTEDALFDRDFSYSPVDLTQLPQNLKCLRIDMCNFSNVTKTDSGENIHGVLDLTKLPSSLEILSLANNKFLGEIDLKLLPSNMTTLNLNFNAFSGDVNLRHLPQSMSFVDISHNKFSGYRMKREDVDAMNNGTGKLKVLARGM